MKIATFGLHPRRIAATVRRMGFFGASVYLDSKDFALSFECQQR